MFVLRVFSWRNPWRTFLPQCFFFVGKVFWSKPCRAFLPQCCCRRRNDPYDSLFASDRGLTSTGGLTSHRGPDIPQGVWHPTGGPDISKGGLTSHRVSDISQGAWNLTQHCALSFLVVARFFLWPPKHDPLTRNAVSRGQRGGGIAMICEYYCYLIVVCCRSFFFILRKRFRFGTPHVFDPTHPPTPSQKGHGT